MKSSSIFGLLLATAATVSAQVIPIHFDPSDNTSFDGWANITASNYPGYPGFPGSGPWPQPIVANVAGSGDAIISKIANGMGGGAFPATSTLYFGSFTAPQNVSGGTIGVGDLTPLTDVNTIIFQIQFGEALGYDFYNHEPPILMLNGTTPVAFEFSGLVNRYQDGTFFNPETEQDEPIYVNTWAYQWDTSSYGPITSFEIQFSGVVHSQIYAMQLDQSTGIYNTSLVPEPTTVGLLVVGCAFAGTFFRRRNRSCIPAE